VLSQGQAEALGVEQGPAHQSGVLDARSVIGKKGEPQGREFTHGGKVLATSTQCYGSRWDDLEHGSTTEFKDVRGDRDRIDRWHRIGHGHESAIATFDPSGRARRHCLSRFAAGLAKVCVEIDKRRSNVGTLCIQDGSASGYIEPIA
jgi:hypothetical protein